MNEIKDITITLPIDTVNACLGALAKTPYEFAQPHIDLVRDRASKALQEEQAKAAAKADPGTPPANA